MDALGDLLTDHPWITVVAIVVVIALLGRRRRRPRPHPGQVWFALVPFADGTGAKDRPVLVLSVDGRRCTVARFTSQNQEGRRDYVRVPSGVPGLPKASWLDLRTTTLERSAFRRRTGAPGAAFVGWYHQAQRDR